MRLPDAFRARMFAELGADVWHLFEESLYSPSPVSVRIHPRKYSDTLQLAERVPWCPSGFYLDSRPSFTLDPAFHCGSYYVQEASSMSLWTILNENFQNKSKLKILDLCGAPGGKSTLVAEWLDGQGLLVSNEVIRNRAYTLKQNLIKSGYANIMVSNNDPSDFSGITSYFDIIIADAPCSGEGMFRKDVGAISEWSTDNVKHCTLRQQRILSDILPALKPDGILIYSTCTFNDAENIENVDRMCNSFGLQPIHSCLENFDGIVLKSGKYGIGYQFYPHKIRGEGFFIAALKKSFGEDPILTSKDSSTLSPLTKKENEIIDYWVKNDAGTVKRRDKKGTIHSIPLDNIDDASFLSTTLRLIHCGLDTGTIQKDLFIPDHHLALSFIVHPEIRKYELELSEALSYLKKELNSVKHPDKGWIQMTYKGNGLGWIKNIGDRINNYLPNEWRIRMDIKSN